MQLKDWFKKPEHLRLLIIGTVFWVPLIVFFKLAGEVLEREPIPADIAVLRFMETISNPVLDSFLYVMTEIGDVLGTVLIVVLLTGLFLYKRRFKDASILVAAVGGAAAANVVLKGLFDRPRPSLFRTEVVETSFSFPSGHAMGSSALALTLILLAWKTRWRWPVTIVAVLYMIIVSFSRPYFGVHYPSDILAGWCASIAWVLIVFVATKRIRIRKRKNHRTEASLQSDDQNDQ